MIKITPSAPKARYMGIQLVFSTTSVWISVAWAVVTMQRNIITKTCRYDWCVFNF